MHDDGICSDFNAIGAGVEISTLVEEDAMTETYVVGKAQAHAVLDGRPTFHLQNQAVEDAPYTNPQDGRNPAE